MTLSHDTIVAIGSLIGGLVGAVAWLFRVLIMSQKDEIRELTADRDLWREVALRHEVGPRE